jgi:hypothetical protein
MEEQRHPHPRLRISNRSIIKGRNKFKYVMYPMGLRLRICDFRRRLCTSCSLLRYTMKSIASKKETAWLLRMYNAMYFCLASISALLLLLQNLVFCMVHGLKKNDLYKQHILCVIIIYYEGEGESDSPCFKMHYTSYPLSAFGVIISFLDH